MWKLSGSIKINKLYYCNLNELKLLVNHHIFSFCIASKQTYFPHDLVILWFITCSRVKQTDGIESVFLHTFISDWLIMHFGIFHVTHKIYPNQGCSFFIFQSHLNHTGKFWHLTIFGSAGCSYDECVHVGFLTEKPPKIRSTWSMGNFLADLLLKQSAAYLVCHTCVCM